MYNIVALSYQNNISLNILCSRAGAVAPAAAALSPPLLCSVVAHQQTTLLYFDL
jgi:hypothetical protein